MTEKLAHYDGCEAEDCDALRLHMADLLTRTANALKGEPAPNTGHSWHDLPEVAAATVEQAVRHGRLAKEWETACLKADAQARTGLADSAPVTDEEVEQFVNPLLQAVNQRDEAKALSQVPDFRVVVRMLLAKFVARRDAARGVHPEGTPTPRRFPPSAAKRMAAFERYEAEEEASVAGTSPETTTDAELLDAVDEVETLLAGADASRDVEEVVVLGYGRDVMEAARELVKLFRERSERPQDVSRVHTPAPTERLAADMDEAEAELHGDSRRLDILQRVGMTRGVEIIDLRPNPDLCLTWSASGDEPDGGHVVAPNLRDAIDQLPASIADGRALSAHQEDRNGNG